MKTFFWSVAQNIKVFFKVFQASQKCSNCSCFFLTAMSSYLYIVKYELPIVIQAFTGTNNG